jgi:hypothetical protein
VRYCAAIMVFRAVSLLTSPANPGSSGITTMTWFYRSMVRRTATKVTTDLELSILLSCFNDPLDKCLCYLVLDRAFLTRVRDAEYSKRDQITGSWTLLPYSQKLVLFRSVTNVNINISLG